MIEIRFKQDSAAIDDDDLQAVSRAIETHITDGTPTQKSYALLLAKMIFRIAELKAALPPTGESAEMQDLDLGQLERNASKYAGARAFDLMHQHSIGTMIDRLQKGRS